MPAPARAGAAVSRLSPRGPKDGHRSPKPACVGSSPTGDAFEGRSVVATAPLRPHGEKDITRSSGGRVPGSSPGGDATVASTLTRGGWHPAGVHVPGSVSSILTPAKEFALCKVPSVLGKRTRLS